MDDSAAELCFNLLAINKRIVKGLLYLSVGRDDLWSFVEYSEQ